jgi:hypothetical protein
MMTVFQLQHSEKNHRLTEDWVNTYEFMNQKVQDFECVIYF